MPCVHAYAFAARSGMLEHPGPSGFFDQYFEACFRVAHILKGLEGLSIAVPQLTSVKVCGNSVGPPVPVKRPGRPPREQGKRGPKPKDKRFKSRGGLIAAKIKRSDLAGGSADLASFSGRSRVRAQTRCPRPSPRSGSQRCARSTAMREIERDGRILWGAR